MGRYKVWAHWNHSYDMPLSYLGPISCVFSSWIHFLDGSKNLFPSWATSGLTFRVAAMWWLDDYNILSLLIWQVTFLVHTLFSSFQSLSCPTLCDPMDGMRQASLSITNSRNLLKLMSIELEMPSDHLVLCRPLLLLPPIFSSIRVFYGESVLRIRWSKYWSFSFSISPSNEHSGQYFWIFTPCRSLNLKVEKIRTNLWSCLTKLHISLGIPP